MIPESVAMLKGGWTTGELGGVILFPVAFDGAI